MPLLYKTQNLLLKEDLSWGPRVSGCSRSVHYSVGMSLHEFICIYAKKYTHIQIPRNPRRYIVPRNSRRYIEISAQDTCKIGKAMLTHEQQDISPNSETIGKTITRIVNPETTVYQTCFFWMMRNIFLLGGKLQIYSLSNYHRELHYSIGSPWSWSQILASQDLEQEIAEISNIS